MQIDPRQLQNQPKASTEGFGIVKIGSGISVTDGVISASGGGGGGTPASTVVSETSFGQASAVGTGTDYARNDHTHGTPTDPIPAHVAAGDPHTQYALESALGTMSAQNANAVSISGGTITGITDLAIADGGTGAGTAATAFDNLKQAATTAYAGVVELATDGETAANVVVQGDDSRLSNARTPTAHATSHQDGGSDEINVTGLSGTLLDPQIPQQGILQVVKMGFVYTSITALS